MQICQNLKEAKESLTSMIRSEGMKESLLITLQIVSDFSYAWQLVDAYTPYMQEQIKENPAIVVKLKAIFLKVSILENPHSLFPLEISKSFILLQHFAV